MGYSQRRPRDKLPLILPTYHAEQQMRESQESDAITAIVDDDASVRRGLQRQIRSVGWKAETFARWLLGLALGYHWKAIWTS